MVVTAEGGEGARDASEAQGRTPPPARQKMGPKVGSADEGRPSFLPARH